MAVATELDCNPLPDLSNHVAAGVLSAGGTPFPYGSAPSSHRVRPVFIIGIDGAGPYGVIEGGSEMMEESALFISPWTPHLAPK